MEVVADLHLLREDPNHVLLEKRVPDSSNGRKVEFLAETLFGNLAERSEGNTVNQSVDWCPSKIQ